MAQKKKSTESSQKTTMANSPVRNISYFNSRNLFPLLACILYFAVPFIPDLGAYDNFGPQWLYIVIIDFLLALLILGRKNDYQEAAAKLVASIFSRLYVIFFLIASFSIFFAINRTESLVCYVRLIATIVAFFNMGILLYGRTDLFKIISQILGLILLAESAQTISQFLNGLGKLSNYDIIMALKGTAGNKNIFAAGIIVKIPFVFFGILTFRFWGKVLNIITFTLAALSIFIINSRATYVSLLIIMLLYLAYCLIKHLRERDTEKTIYRTGSILIPVIIAFFMAQLALSNISNPQDENDVKYFGTVTERFASATQVNDASNVVRFRLWKHAIDYTEHHPLMGCGYGNWKIASIPYQRTITNDLFVPVHAHNDYFEAFAELGIAGGLVYLSLFICILIFTIKTIYSEANEETKLVALFSFLAFAGYSVDAFFNFPVERPLSQVFFALTTALNVIAYIKARDCNKTEETVIQKTSGSQKAAIALVSLLLLTPSLYITYLTYQSLIVQRTVLADLNNEPLKLDWKTVVPSFPWIPNLSATAQPIDAIKGRYLYEVGKYDEALKLLDKGRMANPVIGYSEFLKAGVYFRMGQNDSAFRNADFAFYTRPKAKTYYQTYIAILARLRDTTHIKKAFDEAVKYRNEVYVWNLYLMGMLNSFGPGKANNALLATADSSLKIFPGDSTLTARRKEIYYNLPVNGISANVKLPNAADLAAAQKNYNDGIAAFGTGVAGKDNLEKAAEYFIKSYNLNPANYTAMENAAICYFNMRDWAKAIRYFDKEIASFKTIDGKAEYFKGVALINTGKKDEGCSFLQIARTKGWKDADAIIKANCK